LTFLFKKKNILMNKGWRNYRQGNSVKVFDD